jgi:XTP/dITP diphosphohydrolase
VFADPDARPEVEGAEEVARNWEDIKAAEKRRDGLFDGIPPTLPALARAQKMLGRLERAGRDDLVAAAADDDALAARLLGVVRDARATGADAEAALRAALTRLAALARSDAAGPRE